MGVQEQFDRLAEHRPFQFQAIRAVFEEWANG
jgi:hypothetical protein